MVTTNKPVDEFTLNPHEDYSFLIGSYTPTAMPKGFKVELSSDLSESEITSSGTNGRCEFMLHLVNHGEEVVYARVMLI